MVKISWSKNALKSFESICKFIENDSPQNATKVKVEIFNIVDSLIENPERYNRDKFRMNNSGNFRAFEKYKIRVSYSITNTEIRIVRVRHTKMNPSLY